MDEILTAPGYVLSAEYKAALDELIRAYRAGLLGRRRQWTRYESAHADDRHTDVYQVTAVDAEAGTCTVRMPTEEGATAAATEITDVLYEEGHEPQVDDRGQVLRLSGGRLYWHPGGVAGNPPMIRAKAAMTADNTAYDCKYLKADGTEGDSLTAKRPYGVRVENGDTGFLGQDSAGENVWIPCHARQDYNLPICIEGRTSDPSSPTVTRMWLRTDL